MNTPVADFARITLVAVAGIALLKVLVGPGGLVKAGPVSTVVGTI